MGQFSMEISGYAGSVLSGNQHNAILIITALSLVIGLLGAEHLDVLTTLVTFGALTAYILLNIAVLYRFALADRSRHLFQHWLSPIIGTAILVYAIWHADPHAQTLGIIWMCIGFVLAGILRVRSGSGLRVADVA